MPDGADVHDLRLRQGTNRYGSLTLSGTGTDSAGTTFNAVSRTGPTTMSQCYNVDISAGLPYPSVVLVVATDNQTGETMVEYNQATSSTSSVEWVNFPVPPGTVVTTSTGVTFTNLELSGYGGTTTTRLTSNGALTF